MKHLKTNTNRVFQLGIAVLCCYCYYYCQSTESLKPIHPRLQTQYSSLSISAFQLVPHRITQCYDSYRTTQKKCYCSSNINNMVVRYQRRYMMMASISVLYKYKNNDVSEALYQQPKNSIDENDNISKGVVSILTDLVNTVSDVWFHIQKRSTTIIDTTTTTNTTKSDMMRIISNPPTSSYDLLQRIRDDYTINNYLWTGNLDIYNNFDVNCTFTDPTLSFIGIHQYKTNIQNIRPIIQFLLGNDNNHHHNAQSKLLDIQLYDTYIETRWNMIGTLTKVPWKPQIDVIGRTKFWFHQNDTFQIYYYDEIWEIPTRNALFQLVTPACTISNGST